MMEAASIEFVLAAQQTAPCRVSVDHQELSKLYNTFALVSGWLSIRTDAPNHHGTPQRDGSESDENENALRDR
jgi:hypothetical protein